jgi:hypothetical protein
MATALTVRLGGWTTTGTRRPTVSPCVFQRENFPVKAERCFECCDEPHPKNNASFRLSWD